MLEVAKATAKGIKEGIQQAHLKAKQEKLERQRQEAERELEAKRAEEAKKREEQEAIEKEKARLAGLSTNEILAEAVMALRGFYSKYEELDRYCLSLDLRIDDLEEEIERLKSEISLLSDNNQNDNGYE